TCCVIQAFVSIAKGCRQLHPKSDGTRANQGPDKRCRSSEPKVGSSRKPQSQCRMARHLPLNVSAADERGKNSQNPSGMTCSCTRLILDESCYEPACRTSKTVFLSFYN